MHDDMIIQIYLKLVTNKKKYSSLSKAKKERIYKHVLYKIKTIFTNTNLGRFVTLFTVGLA